MERGLVSAFVENNNTIIARAAAAAKGETHTHAQIHPASLRVTSRSAHPIEMESQVNGGCRGRIGLSLTQIYEISSLAVSQ